MKLLRKNKQNKTNKQKRSSRLTLIGLKNGLINLKVKLEQIIVT